MKRSNRLFYLTIVAVTVGLGGIASATSFSFEYDWLTNTPGFSGKIFLDAASGSNGSASNVDLANSYITTPDGTFSFTTSTPFNSFDPFLPNPSITWNTSQILSMNVQGVESPVPGFPSNAFGFWSASASSIGDSINISGGVTIQISQQSDSGRWVARGAISAVPDSSNTAVLLLASGLVLCLATGHSLSRNGSEG